VSDDKQLDQFFEALKDAPEPEAVISLRDATKREIGIRIVPWEIPAVTKDGPEVIMRGAFDGVDPSKVILRLPHKDPPVGRGIDYENRDDGAYMTFKVAKTQAGDEALALADEGVVTGASVSFQDIPGGTQIHSRNGVRLRVVQKARLRETALVWNPTWQDAQVLFTRSNDEETPMAEPTVAPEPQPAPVFDLTPIADAIKSGQDQHQRSLDAFVDRLSKLEEANRQDISIPTAGTTHKASLGDWGSAAIRMLKGEPISPKELRERELDNIITPDNPGLVPDALRTDLLIGVVNRRRPFLESTTEIDAPETGMSIVVPVLSQRSTVAVQAAEKTEVDSTALKVTTSDFPAVSIFGAADVSIQMIRRADRSFMSLLLRDLGHAYARLADARALATLFAAGTTPGTANIDPENLTIGEAWENSMTATDEPPDTMWLSAAGVSAFINAKNDGSNAPLYFSLNAAFRVGNGPGGDVSALRPIYVPALDSSSVDVMIGPSSGFVWAEDGDIQLTADVPSKAGRDIGLGGILFFIPRYPAAFTTYDLGS
jgi:HK97 family phage prohead protease